MNEHLTNNKNLFLFVGFECEARSDWKELMVSPNPPKNYKKPEAISEWLAKRWGELETEAPSMPLVGRVTLVHVMDGDGKKLFAGPGGKTYSWIGEFIVEQAGKNEKVLIFGLNARDRLHLCALGAAEHDALLRSWGLYLTTFFSTPAEVRQTAEIHDPVRLILGSDGDHLAKVATMARWMNRNDPSFSDEVPRTAEAQAKFALDLVKTFGLGSSMF